MVPLSTVKALHEPNSIYVYASTAVVSMLYVDLACDTFLFGSASFELLYAFRCRKCLIVRDLALN